MLYAEKEAGYAEFDERDRPVPEDLTDEYEFQGGAAACKGYEAGTAAEAVEDGCRCDGVICNGENLECRWSASFPFYSQQNKGPIPSQPGLSSHPNGAAWRAAASTIISQ